MATYEQLDFPVQVGTAFLQADSGVECAQVWNDGSTSWLVIGGQTRGWSQREYVWVHDRLPAGTHFEKQYSGYWAGNSVPSPVVATNLRISGAAETELPGGWPLARVTAAVPVAAVWDDINRADGSTNNNVQWRGELLDADTGAVIQSNISQSKSITFSPLAAGTRAILRVGTIDTPRGAYQWPPPEYATVTGNAAEPSQFRWTHPTLGALYFDPKYQVGARPYDRTNPVQANLLDLETQYLADGTATKKAEWVKLLISFNSDGTQTADDGEFSLLRVVVGPGTQWQEAGVREGATLPCLWRCMVNPLTLQPLGPVTAWHLDAALRSVSALEVDADNGTLLIGGACSTRNGPLPALLQVQPVLDIPGDTAGSELTLSLFYCECAMALGKAIHGIAKTDGGLRAVSPCDSFRHYPTRPLLRRLAPAHPGGRNAISWRNGFGENYVFSTEAGDFATRDDIEEAFGFLVLETANGPTTGAPLAKQLDSQLAILGGRVWGVEDPAPKLTSGIQYLCNSETGAQWSRLTSWGKTYFDAGTICRIGDKTQGAAMWVFGWNPQTARPRALRVQGSLVTRNIDMDFFIQRASTLRWHGEDWMVGVGMKAEVINGSASYSRHQTILLTRAQNSSGPGSGPGIPTNGKEAYESMPDGTKISCTAFTDYDQYLASDVAATAFNADLVPAEELGVAGTSYNRFYPYALWLRVDGNTPFELTEGAPVTSAVLAELQTFDQLAQIDIDRFFATPATKRIEALLLLAPDWTLNSKTLKQRA